MTSNKDFKKEYEHMRIETLFDKMKKSINDIPNTEPEQEDKDEFGNLGYFT